MKKKITEMTAKNLKIISQLFLEKNNVSEHKLARFSLDIYFPDDKIAFEYDGPDHYDKVANHERDLRKNELCLKEKIKLVRWPYYFQLTKDVAKYIFKKNFSENKYQKAIQTVYGTSQENEILFKHVKNYFTAKCFNSKNIFDNKFSYHEIISCKK